MRRHLGSVVLLVVLAFAPSGAAAATPDYFPLPSGYSVSGFGVAGDGHGNIWFGAKGPGSESISDAASPSAQIGRLDTTQAVAGANSGFSFFPTPNPAGQNCCATFLRSVAWNAFEQKLYFVRSDGVYGSAAPAQMQPGQAMGITDARLETPPWIDIADVAAIPGAAGVWFSERSTSNVAYGPSSPNAGQYPGARVARWNGTLSEGPNIATQFGNVALNSLRYDAKPDGVTVDASGIPWFAEADPGNAGYRIARYTPGTDHYDEWSLPCGPGSPCSGSYTGTGARDVAVDSHGAVWYTNEIQKSFGRFNPVSSQFEQYTIVSVDPTLAGGTPRQLAAAPDGTIWMTVYGGPSGSQANAIVRIVPSGIDGTPPSVSVYKTGLDDPPLGIAADDGGNIWFGDGNATSSKLGQLAGVVSVAPPTPPGGGPQPPAPPSPPGTTTPKPALVGTLKLTPVQTGNGAIDTNQICVGPPESRCTVIYRIREREYVPGFGGASAWAAAKKQAKKPRVLATKAVTLRGGQKAKVSVRLGKLGRRILTKKRRLSVVFTATQQLAGGKTKVVYKKTLTMTAKKSAARPRAKR